LPGAFFLAYCQPLSISARGGSTAATSAGRPAQPTSTTYCLNTAAGGVQRCGYFATAAGEAVGPRRVFALLCPRQPPAQLAALGGIIAALVDESSSSMHNSRFNISYLY
jgi:hypothetical protein